MNIKHKKIPEIRENIINNARELLVEAEKLYKIKSFSRCFFHSHTAKEELAKLPMLNTAYMEPAKVDMKRLNKRLTSHYSKAKSLWGIDYLITGTSQPFSRGYKKKLDSFYKKYFGLIKAPFPHEAKDKKEIIEFLAQYYSVSKKLVSLREKSLYVDIAKDKIYTPSELFDNDFVKSFLDIVKVRFKFFEYCEVPDYERNSIK